MHLLGYFKLIVKCKHYNNTRYIMDSRTINSDVRKFSEVVTMTDNVNMWHYTF